MAVGPKEKEENVTVKFIVLTVIFYHDSDDDDNNSCHRILKVTQFRLTQNSKLLS